MRPSLISPAIFLLTSLIPTSTALVALESSPCAPQCGNVLSSTTASDITCFDADYATSSAGVTFQNCVSCQLTSTYVDPVTKQTDIQWALYNIRYAFSFCLFGYPNNTQVGGTPCIITPSCGGLENAIEYDSLAANSSAYGYCSLFSNNLVTACTSCLTVQTLQYYLTNFVVALQAGCLQQPNPGSIISLQGSLFSTTKVNITSPTAVPSSSSIPQASGPLNLGVKVGIAVGGIILLLCLSGCFIIWAGRRRRRRFLAERQRRTREGWGGLPGTGPAPTGGARFSDSPQSQKALVEDNPWGIGGKEDESPQSLAGEKAFFSPYTSQYSSPVSATDKTQGKGMEWPLDRNSSQGDGSLGFAKVPTRSMSVEEQNRAGGGIEMRTVAPLIRNPGAGRGASGGLTYEDAIAGNAL